jgi:hypothetical protein
MADESSGKVLNSSTGGTSGEHATGSIEPSAVGPSTSDQFNRIRINLIPIACWRVDDLRFDFDSSFVRPDISAEIAHLAALMKQHKGSPISLFGHADPVGDDEYNKILSGRRAAAIYGLLTRNVQLWENLYTIPFSGDNWANTTIADVLWYLGYAASADNMNSPQTTQALKKFQTDNGLPANGYADKTTRARLFNAYMDKIARDSEGNPFVLTKEDFLARGADPEGKGDYQGCGEFCPILMFSAAENQAYQNPGNRTARNEDNAPNRRVVAFVFRRGARVSPQKWPCSRANEGTQSCRKRFWSDAAKRRSFQEKRREAPKDKDTFACRFYDRMANGSPCESVLKSFGIRLLDPFARPMPHAPYRISTLQGEGEGNGSIWAANSNGRSDSQGWAVIRDITKPVKARVEWRYPIQGEEQTTWNLPFSYCRDIFLCISEDPKDEETGAAQRLYNLGYSAGIALEDNIRKFQRAYGLEETGELGDIRQVLWEYHDSANPPWLPSDNTA